MSWKTWRWHCGTVAVSLLFAVSPASAQDPAASGNDEACHLSAPCHHPNAQQTFTDAKWVDYQDSYCMIHSTKPKGCDPGADNNALLYTAEACVIRSEERRVGKERRSR